MQQGSPTTLSCRGLEVWAELDEIDDTTHQPTRKVLLSDISLSFRAGEVIALMGPSGSGKSTLLNALAGRKKNTMSGVVQLCGRPVGTDRKARKRIGYVVQQDLMLPNLTVAQTLAVEADLRLNVSSEEKKKEINRVVSSLGLEGCLETRVGGALAPGVSGGEKKRVNIARELLTSPKVLLMDEPTSGLDSSTALSLIRHIRTLGDVGHTVVISIHQPSSRLFSLFSQVVCLRNGRVMYHGTAGPQFQEFAEAHGLVRPDQISLSDWMLEVAASAATANDDETAAAAESLIEATAKRKRQEEDQEEGNEPRQEDDDDNDDDLHDAVGMWVQTRALAKRALLNSKGAIFDKWRLYQVYALALICGLLWFNSSMKEEALRDRQGLLFFVAVFWPVFNMFMSMFDFFGTRIVFNEDRLRGTYRVTSYFIGTTLAEAPMRAVTPVAFGIIVYWMAALNPEAWRFLAHILVLMISVVVGESVGLAVSAYAAQMEQAVTIMSLYALGSMLVGGFYIESDNLIDGVRALAVLSPITHVYNLMLHIEFDDPDATFTVAADPTKSTGYLSDPIVGAEVLDRAEMPISWGGSIGVLCAMIVALRGAAYLALKYCNKPEGL